VVSLAYSDARFICARRAKAYAGPHVDGAYSATVGLLDHILHAVFPLVFLLLELLDLGRDNKTAADT